MKLSEMKTKNVTDSLVEASVYIDLLINDEKLVDLFTSKYKFPWYKAIKISSYLFNERKEETYNILSILNQKSIEEIYEQSSLDTLKQMVELINDKELIVFFTSFSQQVVALSSALSGAVSELSPPKRS